MHEAEMKELEELRAWKAQQEGRALDKAFARLEQLRNSGHDPLVSVRAFRVIEDCLLALKECLE